MRGESINKFLLGKTMKNTKISLILPPKSSDTKKRQLEKRICKNIKKYPKAFYKYVTQKMKMRDDITEMTINESSTSCNELEIAEALNTYFASIVTTNIFSDSYPQSKGK